MWRLFISSMMGSLTITYMPVNATAWHILPHSLAAQRANKGPIEKTEISIPNGLMEGSCEWKDGGWDGKWGGRIDKHKIGGASSESEWGESKSWLSWRKLAKNILPFQMQNKYL